MKSRFESITAKVLIYFVELVCTHDRTGDGETTVDKKATRAQGPAGNCHFSRNRR